LRATARVFGTEKKIIGRIIRETGEAFLDYMSARF
jgi:hypothetical protein